VLELAGLVEAAGSEALLWQRLHFVRAQFAKYKKHMTAHGSGIGFIKEYEHLAKLERKEKRPLVKLTKPILFKNRYLDIIPVEMTNVKLGLPGLPIPSPAHMAMTPPPGSDFPQTSLAELEAMQAEAYINANYVELWTELTYVAAQGPLPNTVLDFWKMVWQQDSAMIVMLTNLIERGIEKCHRYWPSSSNDRSGSLALPARDNDEEAALYAVDVGPFVVELLSQEASQDYTLRRLRMTHIESGVVKPVLQAHYTAWPDQGIPDPEPFARFCNVIDSKLAALKPAPLIVHCSAGVGRTGVFVACHNILQHMRNYLISGSSKMAFLFDVMGTVRRMRQHRPFMVQNADQYRFVYLYLCAQIEAFFDSAAVSEFLATAPPGASLPVEQE